MENQYNIKRWDVIISGNSNQTTPIIYITPDIKFLEFIKNNNYSVLCKISGTDMIYDGKLIPGIVDKSSSIPNCRPNFFDKTGYYVITLIGTWNGYPDPDKLGVVTFEGFNVGSDNKLYMTNMTNMTNSNSSMQKLSNNYGGLSMYQIFGIFILLLLVIILFFIYF